MRKDWWDSLSVSPSAESARRKHAKHSPKHVREQTVFSGIFCFSILFIFCLFNPGPATPPIPLKQGQMHREHLLRPDLTEDSLCLTLKHTRNSSSFVLFIWLLRLQLLLFKARKQFQAARPLSLSVTMLNQTKLRFCNNIKNTAK